MSREPNSGDPVDVDEQIRSAFKITTESTYAYLVRRATAAGRPLEFVSRMRMATTWLRPRLTTRTRPLYDEIATLLDEIRTYAHVSSNRVWHPPLTVRVSKTAEKAVEAHRYTAKRQRVMLLFEQADSMQRLEPLLVAQDAFKQAQSARASKPRKAELDEETRKRIAKRYWTSKQEGTAYGLVKELARQYDVTTTTIQNIVKKYQPPLN